MIRALFRPKLGRKLAIRIILFSSLITLLLTAIQLLVEYRSLLKQIDKLPTQIEASLGPALGNAVWAFDKTQIQTLLKGINDLDYIERSELKLKDGQLFTEQVPLSENTRDYPIEIYHLSGGKEFHVGHLTITSSLDEALHTILHQAAVILLKNGLKTTLVVIFLMLLFHNLIGRHLLTIINYMQQINGSEQKPAMQLQRSEREKPDELDQLTDEYNQLQSRLQQAHQAHLDESDRREQAEKHLHHLERVSAMGELATSLAHELNQPLSGIMGYSDMAARLSQQPEPSPQLKTCIDRIGSEAERASQIIKRTRAFLQKKSRHAELIDFVSTIEDSIELIRHRAQQFSIRIDFNSSAKKPALIMADPVQLQQVLVNLMMNAIDALKESEADQPGIQLTLESATSEWKLSVSDNGPGINADLADKIFDPFISSKENGMGVGLAICCNIVETLHGTLDAGNSDTGGACFTLTLPVASQQEECHEEQ